MPTKQPRERIPRGTPQPKRTLAERSLKSTNEEIEKRIRIVADMLAVRHLPDSLIRKALFDQFGIGWRQADRYMSRARKFILERTNRDKDEHVAQAYAFYESVMRDPEATRAEKMAAQRDIRQLLGLDSPMRVAQTTPDGEAVEQHIRINVANLTTAELIQLRDLKLKLLSGLPAHAVRNLTSDSNDSNTVAADGNSYDDLGNDRTDIIDGEVESGKESNVTESSGTEPPGKGDATSQSSTPSAANDEVDAVDL